MFRLCPLLLLFLAPLEPAFGFDHEHSEWTQVLREHVRLDGGISQVDYRRLQKSPGQLHRYLAQLGAVREEEYRGWSEPQRLAFLINAYNAFTVRLIVDNYPVDSIKDLGGFLSSPWKKKFFSLLGEKRHLDEIEHEMIRRDFQEPRIHFAVNCAAISCPPLRREAFVAHSLEGQLEEAARAFLADSRRNRYDPQKLRLELSSILKWYGSDFRLTHGSVESFVAPRITDDPDERESIRSGRVRITFLDYDWGLNDLRAGN